MNFPMHIVTAAGYVEDGNGNVLLVKVEHRGWDTPGGQIEVGESIEEGLLREILEESGVIARVRCLAGIYSNVGQNVWHDGITTVPTKVNFDFICDYVSGEPRPSSETSEVIWVPKADVMGYVTSPAARYRFEKVLEFDGRVICCSYVTKPEFMILGERFV